MLAMGPRDLLCNLRVVHNFARHPNGFASKQNAKDVDGCSYCI